MKTKETTTGQRFNETRREPMQAALTLPLAGLVLGASADEMVGLAARVEAVAGPLVGRLATDVVQDLAGGPGAVTAFLKEIGINGMTVDRNTAGFMRDFDGFESGLENIARAVEFSMSDPVAANAPSPRRRARSTTISRPDHEGRQDLQQHHTRLSEQAIEGRQR